MSLWTAFEIAEAVDGEVQGAFCANGVTFDSREVGPGDLFIALNGEATDGHRFIASAFDNGAAGAIVSESIEQPHVRVADTMAALNALGASDPAVARSVCDVADGEAVARMFDQVSAAFGGLDALVNNAGIAGPTAACEDIAFADWERTLAVNLTGQFLCAQRAIPWLRKALSSDPEFRPAQAALGQALLLTGKPQDAIPLLRSALFAVAPLTSSRSGI